ncbi:MAG: GTPase Era [Acidobacteriota bacterium]|nr:GTPase Era [Acidobacteriota bacterium]
MHSGFVTILGRPNAGKSTLLNSLVGEKLAIVTHKAQTTRNRITGIVNVKRKAKRPAGQIVFVDTPGVHKPDDQLNKRMMQEVYDSIEGCDLILLIVDATQKFGTGDEFVLEIAKRAKVPVFLLLNKIDLLPKPALLPAIAEWSERHGFAQIVPISAEKGLGQEELLTAVANALPEGPQYFPEDQITDQPERFVVAELIREQILINTAQEVPYASGVIIERFEEGVKLTKIAAAIFVERDGQKAIVIGRQGAMLKQIGTRARQQIERILGTKVFLELFVKVKEGWRDSAAAVDEAIDWRKQIASLGKSYNADEAGEDKSRSKPTPRAQKPAKKPEKPGKTR